MQLQQRIGSKKELNPRVKAFGALCCSELSLGPGGENDLSQLTYENATLKVQTVLLYF